ncbi:serine protease [Streptomyces sp. NPDC002889]|uniref:S1 family peptidase n=1 Tax=Streptomyces sp. NPDC002889 TaxID=3364669 RepID=UPI0036738827
MSRRGARGVELPPVEEFPAGPRRVLLENLHILYRAADQPGVRAISEGLADGDFRATMNRDLVAKILGGRRWPTAWQLDSLVRWLADRAIGPADVKDEVVRFLRLYELAEGDGTLRMQSPTNSRIRITRAEGQSVGAGVLLGDGSVLTRAHVVGERTKDYYRNTLTDEDVLIQCVEGDQKSRRAHLLWSSQLPPDGWDLTLLTLEPAIGRRAGPRWGAPRAGARVRVYGFPKAAHEDGVWFTGNVIGPGGGNGDWQLDLARPDALSFQGFSGAGVYDDSGFVIGLISTALPNTTFAWMTPPEVLARTVPSWPRQ